MNIQLFPHERKRERKYFGLLLFRAPSVSLSIRRWTLAMISHYSYHRRILRARAYQKQQRGERDFRRRARRCVADDLQKSVISAYPRRTLRARYNINLRSLSRSPAPVVLAFRPRPAAQAWILGSLSSPSSLFLSFSQRQRKIVLGFGVAGSRASGMKHRVAPWDRAEALRVPRSVPLPCTHAFFTPVD